MARFAFVGPSYSSQSVNADCQVTRNWYPESIESQQGKSGFAMYPTPGLAVFSQLPDSPLRGLFTINGRTFAVAGSTFLEIFTNGTFANLGAVANDGLMASITGGPLHVLVASGGIGYALTLATNAFAPPANMVSPRIVAYSDGYYMALQVNSDIFQFSTLLDATTWSLANVNAVSFFADNVISMCVDHREICLFGPKQSLVYSNTGDPNTPFLPINGAFAEQGSAAIFGVAKLDNTVFWVGANEHGGGIGWKAQGYTPVRVTNHAIELAWQSYPTIADAVSYGYQDQGHAFWVVYFPSANPVLGGTPRGATWVFDVATGLWHERDHLDNGVHYAHRSNCHTYAFGKHLVGDWNSGTIYQMAINLYDDFGMPIQRLRRAPHVSKEQEWQIHNALQVDVETGLGNQVDPGSNPVISLRWSDDGGHTWSNQYDVSAGAVGNYKVRAIWRRLGRSRDRVYEVQVSDPIPWRIVDAYLNADPDYKPTERMIKQVSKGA